MAVKHIFLIGMPGAGKTYWGRRIADAYRLSFADLDEYISQQVGGSVPVLFAKEGEEGFRKKEQDYLLALAEMEKPHVVACGGGTPCFFNNMQVMKEHGVVVYLESDISGLVENLKYDHQVRPLLQNRDLGDALEKMLAERRSWYEQAHYILHTQDISIDTFAEMIALCTDKH